MPISPCMEIHYCLTPSLRPAATGPKDPLDPQALQAPQGPWVLPDFLAPRVPLGVLDTWEPRALLDPKDPLATQERKAREDCLGNLAPKG